MSLCESSVDEKQTHSSLCSGTHALVKILLLPAKLLYARKMRLVPFTDDQWLEYFCIFLLFFKINLEKL